MSIVQSVVEAAYRRYGRPPEKAAIGAGVAALTYDTPLWAGQRSPQNMAKQAQALYHHNPHVHDAEFVVSSRFANLEWHLEDENDDEITDQSPVQLRAVRDLIEKPQAAIPGLAYRMTRRELWQLTARHMGLCGYAFWYEDQTEALGGTPAGFIYVNPGRVWSVLDKAGNLVGWSLDGPQGTRGATPLEPQELLPVWLDPPDTDYFGIGLVESLGRKAQLTTLADTYASGVLGSGGRLAGMIAPRDRVENADQWKETVRSWRNIVEDPNAAKRLLLMSQPVDFTRTSGTPVDIGVTEIAKMAREDILAHWGVPPSQAAYPTAAGLNSGQTKGYDEAVLYQGAVHSRVSPFWETIQYRLLDRFAKLGITVELEIEEPEFDDEAPRYSLAKDAISLPLRNRERRAQLGLDPLGIPDLDDAIVLPVTSVTWGVAPDETVTQIPSATPSAPAVGPTIVAQKARLPHPDAGRYVPAAKRDLLTALRSIRRDVAERIRAKADHIAAKPRDTASWWNPKDEAARLTKALRPHVAALSTATVKTTRSLLDRPAKADAAEEAVVAKLLASVGLRVVDIADATRDAIVRAIEAGLAEGLSPARVADRLEELAVLDNGTPAFDELRAETIARTEMATTLNLASTASYSEFGITSVDVVDGDGDEVCAEADGAVWSLDEADANPLGHPNCTRTFSPHFEGLAA